MSCLRSNIVCILKFSVLFLQTKSATWSLTFWLYKIQNNIKYFRKKIEENHFRRNWGNLWYRLSLFSIVMSFRHLVAISDWVSRRGILGTNSDMCRPILCVSRVLLIYLALIKKKTKSHQFQLRGKYKYILETC